MGTYLNPGNIGFKELAAADYVDKTGMIRFLNRAINTPDRLICISRPRRFGKSYAAKMLCAYYDKSAVSKELFDRFEIASDETYLSHLNRYDVLYLDMTGVIGEVQPQNLIGYIRENIVREILEAYPAVETAGGFVPTLVNAVQAIGNKFIMIIDEWDAPIREAGHPELQTDYLRFLRSLFKNSGATSQIFAAAYMTGILPIKKDGSQSAISDFDEYTMVKPRHFAEYVGFTKSEVERLCKERGESFDKMKYWYDGYSFPLVGSIYNPNSVMKALRYRDFDSYWTETSASESLMYYIGMDYDGLSKTVAELVGGVDVSVDPRGFSNDLVTFRGRDDILTLLIHLGYLAYDEHTGTARIPNEEIRVEFERAVRHVPLDETKKRICASRKLLDDTVHGREEAVAAAVEAVHKEETTPLFYNGEQALRSVIKLAYFCYKDYYLHFEELPSGNGYADIVYFPRPHTGLPALVIELKWNQTAESAIAQIKEKDYPLALEHFGGEILLVGISYDTETKKHRCRIERVGAKG